MKEVFLFFAFSRFLSLPLAVRLSLSVSIHTPPHPHAHTHTYIHPRTLTRYVLMKVFLLNERRHSFSFLLSHMLSLSLSQVHHISRNWGDQTHIHTHVHTHAHTRTHLLSLSLSLSLSLPLCQTHIDQTHKHTRIRRR